MALIAASVLVSSSAFALNSGSGSQSDRDACTPDAFRLCGQFIPSADRIYACLKSPKNKTKLSAPCRKVIWKGK
jgi:hypothetical protein